MIDYGGIVWGMIIGAVLAYILFMIFVGIANLLIYALGWMIGRFLDVRDLRKRNKHRRKCGLPPLK